MIIHFTGTGNSRFVADALADRLGDENVSMNDLLRAGTPGRFTSDRPYVIVCPVFAWRVPVFVEDFIRRSEFTGDRRIYLVVTMGSETGRAAEHAAAFLAETGLEFMGMAGIAMTDNYILMSDIPDGETIRRTNERAVEEAFAIADRISNDERLECTDRTRFAGMKSGFINRMFTKHMSSPDFTVSDSCTGCGACERFCPGLNIVMDSGRPVFQGHCLDCLGCLHRCPSRALDIGRKTRRRGRYVCPEYVPR